MVTRRIYIWKLPISYIKKEHILRMHEKLLAYNINIIHVKGTTHTLAAKLSRYPNISVNFPDMEDGVAPTVASKISTFMSSENEIDHPHILKDAKLGEEEEDYKYMKSFMKNKYPIKTVKKERDLHVIQGDNSTLSLYNTNDGEVIMKNAKEVFIPRLY